jgi:hypothetical protein
MVSQYIIAIHRVEWQDKDTTVNWDEGDYGKDKNENKSENNYWPLVTSVVLITWRSYSAVEWCTEASVVLYKDMKCKMIKKERNTINYLK